MRRINYLLAIFTFTVAAYFIFAGFFQSTPATSAFTVEAGLIGIYWDSKYANEVYSIDWGNPSPGSSKPITVYIRNEANSPVRLSLNTTDWNPPEASEHISLDWNYTGSTISPEDATQTTLKLSISPHISGVTTFSFNIFISAYEFEGCNISDIEHWIFSAPANSIYFVPTGNIYDDSVFYAFYAYTESPQIITSPIQSSASSVYLDDDGCPLFTGNIVTFGGRTANRMVSYYENAGIALVSYEWNGTHHLFTRISDGSHIYAVEGSTYNASEKDYFVIQIYKDGSRFVLSEWGIGAEGTYAGGLCFTDIIRPNLQDYTYQYYIYSWMDTNADGMPQQDEIRLEKTDLYDMSAISYAGAARKDEIGAVEITQPISMPSMSDIEDNIVNAPVNSVYFVPTGNIYDDSAFYAFYAYKENAQIIIPPTQSSASSAYLDGDGGPLFSGHIVTFGGKFANRVVSYYEDAGIAKIGFANNGTHRIFRRISDGAHIYAVDSSTYNETEKDYFVFQIYTDGDRYVLSEWGFGAWGTYAGGLCFINQICPNMEDYTDSYYVFSWSDVNTDSMPQPEEITLETSGI